MRNYFTGEDSLRSIKLIDIDPSAAKRQLLLERNTMPDHGSLGMYLISQRSLKKNTSHKKAPDLSEATLNQLNPKCVCYILNIYEKIKFANFLSLSKST